MILSSVRVEKKQLGCLFRIMEWDRGGNFFAYIILLKTEKGRGKTELLLRV